MNRHLAITLCSSMFSLSTAIASAEDAKPAGTTSSQAGPSVVRIAPPVMPPSRTYCTIESSDGQFAASVEWDPLINEQLSRRVIIPKGVTSTTVSCHAEAIHPSLKPELNLAWVFPASAKCTMPLAAEATCPVGFVQEVATGSRVTSPQIVVTGEPAPPASQAELVSSSSALRAPTVSANAFRSFGVPDEEAVQEIFQAIAEVVTEKAQERGMKLLETRLLNDVCKVIKFDRTCDALRAVRLEDLASSGELLVEALIGDVVDRASAAVIGKLPRAELLNRVIVAATDLIAGRSERARGAAAAILIDLLTSLKASGSNEAVALVSIISDCNGGGACTLTEIKKRLATPKSYYNVDIEKIERASAVTFVTTALAVLRPAATTTEAEQIASTVGLIVDAGSLVCDELGASSSPPSGCEFLRPDLLEAVRGIVDGVLERDMNKVVVNGITLALRADTPTSEEPQDAGLDLLRAARTLAALGSFLSVSTTGREPSEDERSARREARKKALASLIDEYGDRSNRRGDVVFSIGSNLMVGPAGVAYLIDQKEGEDSEVFQATPISLTFGVALDYHAMNGAGFHVDLSPFDLGGYLTVRSGGVTECGEGETDEECEPSATPIAPGDVLRPSVTVAATYLFADANLILFGGLSGGFAPKITTDSDSTTAKQSAIYGSAVAGLYIPIFDLN